MSPERPLPSVSVVVVAHEAAQHLPHCLDSIAELDYPEGLLDTIVVDNASTDGTAALLRRRYPWATVYGQARNLGFAEANNVAARASSADCLALLNADMRVERSWLRELVASYDADAGVAAVAGVILDWAGERVDFAGGTLNFTGHGNHLGHGRAADEVAVHDGAELLFACGGAMLVDRRVFLDAGGFDGSYFIYFEDVDLGWRLRLLGHRTVLAARAVAYHRGHGTTSAFRAPQLRVLYERNALRTLIKNVEGRNLDRVLAASLLLLAERARLDSGSERSSFELATEGGESERVRRLGLAPLHAVGDVLGELEELLARRREVQRRRQVGDDEVFALFGRPFQPAGRDDDAYLRATGAVARAFGLDETFSRRRAERVLVLADEATGRTAELAPLLAGAASATLALPEAAATDAGRVETVAYRSAADVLRLGRENDVAIVAAGSLEHAEGLAASGAVVAVDLAGADPAELSRERALLDATDAVLVDGEPDDALAALLGDGGDRSRLVTRSLAPATDVTAPTLLTLVEEPWRWRAARSGRPRPATEDTQLLLGRLRREAARDEEAARTLPLRARARAGLRGALRRERTTVVRCELCGHVTAVTSPRWRRTATCGECIGRSG